MAPMFRPQGVQPAPLGPVGQLAPIAMSVGPMLPMASPLQPGEGALSGTSVTVAAAPTMLQQSFPVGGPVQQQPGSLTMPLGGGQGPPPMMIPQGQQLVQPRHNLLQSMQSTQSMQSMQSMQTIQAMQSNQSMQQQQQLQQLQQMQQLQQLHQMQPTQAIQQMHQMQPTQAVQQMQPTQAQAQTQPGLVCATPQVEPLTPQSGGPTTISTLPPGGLPMMVPQQQGMGFPGRQQPLPVQPQMRLPQGIQPPPGFAPPQLPQAQWFGMHRLGVGLPPATGLQ
eukprot:NODE_13394_length_1168_cov_5.301633.p1 GENE.NODE_13394_length_1168_cov_5.301633~~NODE_13394_length_1168_cov_5.301633.p1  ORF type:complete len:280 (+),score=72.04 NODE_13394_length_1168_cov_5.301633:193-1032(+)